MPSRFSLGLAALATLLVLSACERDLDPLGLAPFPSDPVVFADGIAPNVDFQAFADSKTDALSVDPLERRSGSSSLRARVPLPSDPSGSYAGGAFVASVPRDLTSYNALTFWARASVPITLNTAGLGNDNTGTSRFAAEAAGGLPVSTGWTKLTLPIPDASFLAQEAGLFFFAEGAEGDAAYDIWFDDIQFESLGTLANPRPIIPTETKLGTVGSTGTITGTQYVVDVSGTDVTMNASAAYFSFSSSDPSVATVDDDGVISFLAPGTTSITATLAGRAASGVITVEADAPPSDAAPTPTAPAEDAISVFSNAYTDVPVNSFAVFGNASVEDAQVAGDDVKIYTNLGGSFEGIEFTAPTIDATDANRFHMDIWTPDPTADPAVFRVKLVDFGADGAFGGGDDSEHELVFTANTTPGLVTRDWVSIDVPLSAFAGLASRANLAQIILSGDLSTVYADNIYFYDDGAIAPPMPTEPTAAAPTPTEDAGSVISLFSDAYTDVTVDTWNTSWSSATYEEVQVDGNDTKKYSSLDFNGIETTSSPVDASSMTRFRVDVWTANASQFGIKIVDLGADGTVGGGDDSEHQLDFNSTTTPALTVGEWVTIDVPLTDFVGLTGRTNLGQYIIVGQPTGTATVWLDNLFFYDDGAIAPPGPTGPTEAAPTPTKDEGSVVSLFSDAYTDVTVDTWNTSWSSAIYEEIQIDGNDTKKYSALDFNGIETTSSPVDASGMSHLSVDVWTPDATQFSIKLVDFGPDGAFGGGDDSESQLDLNAGTTPALATGAWVTLDIPLTEFTGLTGRTNLGQYIIVGQPTGATTVYLDNLYFYTDVAPTPPSAPPTAAPTPSDAPGNVISLFSNAYTDVAVDSWRTDWSSSTYEELQVAGDDTKKYSTLDFNGIEFTGANSIDASAMTHVRMDIWTPDGTNFSIKLVDWGPDNAFGGGDDTEFQINFDGATTPAIATGGWISLDIPLADFTGLAARANLSQMIIVGQPTGTSTFFVDNVYFRN